MSLSVVRLMEESPQDRAGRVLTSKNRKPYFRSVIFHHPTKIDDTPCTFLPTPSPRGSCGRLGNHSIGRRGVLQSSILLEAPHILTPQARHRVVERWGELMGSLRRSIFSAVLWFLRRHNPLEAMMAWNVIENRGCLPEAPSAPGIDSSALVRNHRGRARSLLPI